MVALTVRLQEARRKAMLVLLLGQRELRNNTLVSGVDLLPGTTRIRIPVRRSDNILNTLARAGNTSPRMEDIARGAYQLTRKRRAECPGDRAAIARVVAGRRSGTRAKSPRLHLESTIFNPS